MEYVCTKELCKSWRGFGKQKAVESRMLITTLNMRY